MLTPQLYAALTSHSRSLTPMLQLTRTSITVGLYYPSPTDLIHALSLSLPLISLMYSLSPPLISLTHFLSLSLPLICLPSSYLLSFLFEACVTDIRFNGKQFPINQQESASNSDVKLVRRQNVVEGCKSDSCANIDCPGLQTCVDLWRDSTCT